MKTVKLNAFMLYAIQNCIKLIKLKQEQKEITTETSYLTITYYIAYADTYGTNKQNEKNIIKIIILLCSKSAT